MMNLKIVKSLKVACEKVYDSEYLLYELWMNTHYQHPLMSNTSFQLTYNTIRPLVRDMLNEQFETKTL